MRDLIGKLMAQEAGELTQAETRELYQHLIDTGLVQKMPRYARITHVLIERGWLRQANAENAAEEPEPKAVRDRWKWLRGARRKVR